MKHNVTSCFRLQKKSINIISQFNSLLNFFCKCEQKSNAMSKRQTMFSTDWQAKHAWLQSVTNDKHSANCNLHKATFKIGNGGLTQVKQHAETLKHKAAIALQDGLTTQKTLKSQNGSIQLSSSSKCKQT